jgi:hypothetical protein
MQGNFANARATAEKVVELAGTEFRGAVASAKIVIGLAESYGGAKAAGKQTTSEALDLAKQLNDPAQLASAQAAFAAALLLAGDSRSAVTNALQAQEVFARLGQIESEWQAWLAAAQASENLGDKTDAREYAMRAKDTFEKLEQRWGGEDYKSYLGRPDIQRLRKQLEPLVASQ